MLKDIQHFEQAKPATRDIVEAKRPTMIMGWAILDLAPLNQLAAVKYGTP